MDQLSSVLLWDTKRVEHVTGKGMPPTLTERAPFVFRQTVFTGIIELKPLFTSCTRRIYGPSKTLKTCMYRN